MKLIPLTQGKFAKVDDLHYEYLMQWKWFANKGPYTFYAVRNGKVSEFIDGKRPQIKMHRVILKLSDPKILVDHKDGDGLNNQISNLRECTASQNTSNRSKQKIKATSIYKGVSIKTSLVNGIKKFYYSAHINSNGNRIRLGTFTTEYNAAKAYDKKARELHGEFANVNFK